MTDSKSAYSEAAKHFVEVTAREQEEFRRKYEQSKKREARYNDQWKALSVNINDIVDLFAPGDDGRVDGMKYIFTGDMYSVVADMSAGYLRIYNNKTRQPLKLDGKPGSREETHFKILKREEM